MHELESPLAVAANDAGAANLMLGWLRDRSDLEIRCRIDGPARRLFEEVLPQWTPASQAGALDGAAMLLSGTSATSVLEHESRLLARERGVRSVGVIDHWVNYRSRFIRNDVLVLPDEIWVCDEYALETARACFPDSIVRLKPNRYLERLVAEVQATPERNEGPAHVLYVLEPARSTWGRPELPGEFQALNYFLERVPCLLDCDDIQIRLRPHPSDAPQKYEQWISGVNRFDVRLDEPRSLSAAVGWADWVVGCETYAMVVALHAGRHVASSLPPWAPACRLPHSGIVHLRDL